MNFDKKKLYIISLLFPIAFILPLLANDDIAKNTLLAFVCIIYACLTCFFIKKRSIVRYEKYSVVFFVVVALVIMITVGLITGVKFGFATNPFTLVYIWKYILPYTAIVISSELIRRVVISQQSRFTNIYIFIALIVLDCVMQIKQGTTERFDIFTSFVGLTVFPAISINILSHYLSKNFGILPATVYKLTILLWRYIFPFIPKTPDMLLAFFKFLFPILLLLFIRALYSKRKQPLSRTQKRIANTFLCSACIIALMLSMLISCKFSYCFLVIASPSMTGSLNVGDGVIYHAYDDEIIEIGDVIVYDKKDIQVVHRVIDIKYIDGEHRFFTKGDANESKDPWYVTKSELVGKVTTRVKYIGIPTLALRSLF